MRGKRPPTRCPPVCDPASFQPRQLEIHGKDPCPTVDLLYDDDDDSARESGDIVICLFIYSSAVRTHGRNTNRTHGVTDERVSTRTCGSTTFFARVCHPKYTYFKISARMCGSTASRELRAILFLVFVSCKYPV